MTDLELASFIKLSYFKSPVLTPDLFNKVIDLIIRILKNQSSGNGSGSMTPEQIRDALQTLVDANRLNASAIHNLAENVIFINPDNGQSVNIIQMIDYLLDVIENSTIQPGPNTGLLFYNDKGEWAEIDWSLITNKPTNTSDFINDGDGSSRYVTINEIQSIVKDAIIQDTGVIEGMTLTSSTSSVIISSGQYVINNQSSIQFIDYVGSTISISSFDTSSNAVYLAIDENQQIVTQYYDFSSEQRRLLAVIGYVEYSSTIDFVKEIRPDFKNTFHQFYDLLEAYGIKSITGNVISSNAGMTLSKSAGTFFGNNINGVDPLKPHKLFLDEQNPISLRYVYGSFSNVLVTSNDVLSTYRLSGGSLVNLSTNSFSFVKISLTISNTYIAELSPNEYADLSSTKADIHNFQSTITNKPKILLTFFVIYKAGISDLNSAISIEEAVILDVNLESINQSITYQQIINALGFVPEDVTNKVTNFNAPNHTTYPTTQAVVDYVDNVLANQPITTERHDFTAQNLVSIHYVIESPVRAFVYINNRAVLANIEYDQVNKYVTITMGRQYSGYIIVESLLT